MLPQLGATGVSAHEVAKQTGFAVIYGPVRAKDIKAFLESGCKATKEMRTVKFTAWDRLVLTPVELVSAAKLSLTVWRNVSRQPFSPQGLSGFQTLLPMRAL